MATWDFIQKQILLGDASTGKSSLLVRLTDDRFLTHSEPTIGVEFGSRLVELTEGMDQGKKVKLQIWDTAGQESFRSITRSYYRGAGGALLCFDLTSRTTFLSCRSWLADLRAWGEPDLVVLVVGTKGDMVRTTPRRRRLEDQATTTEEQQEEEQEQEEAGTGDEEDGVEALRTEVQRWVEEEGLAGFVETSAKEGTGVEEAFNALTRTVHEKHRAAIMARRAAGSSGAASGFRLGGGGGNPANGSGGKCC